MTPFTLADAATAMAGHTTAPVNPWAMVTAVTHDSRAVHRGSLFFALRGQRADGHNFVREALERGAIAAVVEHRVDVPIVQLLVPSTVAAFGELARTYRARFAMPLVAITGSVGKTTTKELVAHSTSGLLETHKSRKNFNNQLGVPTELFLLDDTHRVSVIELAMRGPGEIGYLARIARPNVAVITNVGMSHIEQLGSRDAIASAKAEILEHLDSDGWAILNRADQYFEFLADKARRSRLLSYGHHAEADFRVGNLRYSVRGHPSFTINGVPVTMNAAIGAHHAENAAAAFAVAAALKIAPEHIAARLATFSTPAQRGLFSIARSGATILDSTYNAAPDSMKASIATLSILRGHGTKTVAVLGDMLELGKFGPEAHKYVGGLVKASPVDVLVTVGEASKLIGETAGLTSWRHFESATQAAAYVMSTASDSSTCILVQGSRGLFLESIITALEEGELPVLPGGGSLHSMS